jgi:hypothetical protein
MLLLLLDGIVVLVYKNDGFWSACLHRFRNFLLKDNDKVFALSWSRMKNGAVSNTVSIRLDLGVGSSHLAKSRRVIKVTTLVS